MLLLEMVQIINETHCVKQAERRFIMCSGVYASEGILVR